MLLLQDRGGQVTISSQCLAIPIDQSITIRTLTRPHCPGRLRMLMVPECRSITAATNAGPRPLPAFPCAAWPRVRDFRLGTVRWTSDAPGSRCSRGFCRGVDVAARMFDEVEDGLWRLCHGACPSVPNERRWLGGNAGECVASVL